MRRTIAVLISVGLHGICAFLYLRLPAPVETSVEETALVGWELPPTRWEETPPSSPREFARLPTIEITPPSGPNTVIDLIADPPSSQQTALDVGAALGVPPTPAATYSGPRPLHGVPNGGEAIVYLLDRSASMGQDGRLDLAKRLILASMQTLTPRNRVQILCYHRNTSSVIGTDGFLPADPPSLARFQQALEELTAEGSSAHFQALLSALRLRPHTIFFITDAEDLSFEEMNRITELNRGRSAIHVASIGPNTTFATALHELARRNRGTWQSRVQ